MDEYDILVIGAGAAGLMSASELSEYKKRVLILEAQSRIGGRIFTISEKPFSSLIEAGAEFVHGMLPITNSIIKQADIDLVSMEGKTYHIKKGKIYEEDFIEDFPLLISKVKKLKQDMPFIEFLNQYFSEDKFKPLRDSVISFAEGYDAADVNRVSTFALFDEWTSELNSESFRIKGGYHKLIKFLEEKCKASGVSIYLSKIVKQINWSPGKAEVICSDGSIFYSKKVIITVPLGVLQSEPTAKSHIKFTPDLPHLKEAVKSPGYGSVIKFFMEFKSSFWENNFQSSYKGLKMPEAGFIISDAPIITWWTHLPMKIPLLTGWLGGPQAKKISKLNDEELFSIAVESLSYIFSTSKSFIEQQLTAQKIINWQNDPFALGAYAYITVDSKIAKDKITKPIEETLYFSGEAFYEGKEMGTVEAALASGKKTAGEISKLF